MVKILITIGPKICVQLLDYWKRDTIFKKILVLKVLKKREFKNMKATFIFYFMHVFY